MRKLKHWLPEVIVSGVLLVALITVLSLPEGRWRDRVGYVCYASLAGIVVLLTMRVLEQRERKRSSAP